MVEKTLKMGYDHETRELAQRLIAAQHDRHDLVTVHPPPRVSRRLR